MKQKDPSNVLATDALCAMLQSDQAVLRSIKELEMVWLDRYAVLVLPTIGYLLLADREKSPFTAYSLCWVISAYMLLTVGIHHVLRSERRSYYRVLRSLIRTESLLGFFKADYLALVRADAAFPKGYGPDPGRDGTQPYASFLHRQAYIIFLFGGLCASAGFHERSIIPFVLSCFILDLIWLITVFRRDAVSMKRATEQERSLAGSEPTWFPVINSEASEAESAV